MTDQLKFFSDEWCAAAAAAHQSELAVRQAKALKDPANFNRILAFGVTDRPDLTSHVEIVAGRVVSWSATNLFPDDQIFASFQGKVEHFREVRLVKGTMKDAIENARALNVLIGAWGDLPTDWDV
jgi:hypothetical protein